MASHLPQLQRFFYSHYFFGGLRQAIGVMLPAIVLSGFFQLHTLAMVASIGAACVAVIDQPGGPPRYQLNTMLGAMLLGTVTCAITGLATSSPLILWLMVPVLCFLFSMLTVFGKQGGLMAFACLLIMTLTMRTPLEPHQVLIHTICSFSGGLFYFLYSSAAHRLMWHREEQQALSVALFATADYVLARSQFYDVNTDLEACYRTLMHTQSAMTEAQQAARNTVLRELPTGRQRSDRRRYMSLNLFIDMVALLDTLVATHTDYATLRRTLPDSDVLVFARDALQKLSINVSQIALNVARNQPVNERNSVKAELRAIEYELEQYRNHDLAKTEPEVYALLVQVLRRLRNGARLVARMAEHTRNEHPTALVDVRLEKTLGRFLTRSELRIGMITSNLRLDSPHFRYSIRVAIAAFLGLSIATGLSALLIGPAGTAPIAIHGYWIVLTIIIIMKPGYALTRQRNGWRLIGTLIGCVLALIVFNITNNIDIYFAVLVLACVLGYSLLQVNFMAAAVFNTLYILLVFHFMSPGSNSVIGERLLDTAIGSALALLCSYILPWWEHNFMGSLAKAAKNANYKFLKAGLDYAQSSRRQIIAGTDQVEAATLEAEQSEADVAWRLARKNAYIALGNYTAAFYRMMQEPIRRQKNVPELNNLLIQNHVLASQISAAIPLLAGLATVPTGIQHTLDAIVTLLNDGDASVSTSIETEGELATLAYPLRQMLRAAQLIRHDMRGLETPVPAPRLGRVKVGDPSASAPEVPHRANGL